MCHPLLYAALLTLIPIAIAQDLSEVPAVRGTRQRRHTNPGLKTLRLRLATAKEKQSPAYTTAAYTAQLISHSPDPKAPNLRKEIAAALALLDAIDAGIDPFAGRKGDLRLAYRSPLDQQLQPYRLFIPDSYNPANATPLVIALHGIGRNEGAMFDLYAQNLQKEAARQGFLAVSPKGRSIASQFRGDAESDVLDVLAEVRRNYNVDSQGIYIIGHSMGASGAWHIALNHPGLFAGLGLFAGFVDPDELQQLNNLPLFIVHGDNDKLVPVRSARDFVAAAHSLGFVAEYMEIPGGSHEDIVSSQFAPMLGFLAKQRR